MFFLGTVHKPATIFPTLAEALVATESGLAMAPFMMFDKEDSLFRCTARSARRLSLMIERIPYLPLYAVMVRPLRVV